MPEENQNTSVKATESSTERLDDYYDSDEMTFCGFWPALIVAWLNRQKKAANRLLQLDAEDRR